MAKNELPPPNSVQSGKDVGEIARVWIVDGGLHVSLQKAFDDPSVWGIALLDISRHVARMYSEDGKVSFEENLEKIARMWRAEMDKPTDMGTTSAQ